MAVPTYRSVAVSNEFNGDTTGVVSKPAGTVNGDLMVACVWCESGFYDDTGDLTPPAGWTTVNELLSGNEPIVGLYYKVASSEGTDYTWTVNDGSNRRLAIVTVQTGTYNTTTPIGTTSGVDYSRALAAASALLGAPTITPPVDECLGIAFFSLLGDGVTFTAPTGWTERNDSNNSYVCGCVDTRSLTTSATGTVIPAGSSGSLYGKEAAAMVAVRPVAGPTTVEASAAAAFGGLTATANAVATVEASALAAFGGLAATASATAGEPPPITGAYWGALLGPVAVPEVVEASALAAFGGLIGAANATSLGTHFWEPFTQANGNPSGWSLASANWPVVASNRLETAVTTYEIIYRALPFTLTGDWELIYDGTAPLISGNGGVHVGVFDLATSNGYSAFIGNASHIYRWDAGVQTFITNVGRPGEGGAGLLQNIVRLTYTASSNTLRLYLDGSDTSNVVDGTYDPASWATTAVFISIGNVNTPTQKTLLDSILVAPGIGNTYPPP
jgi:hypothetical protein